MGEVILMQCPLCRWLAFVGGAVIELGIIVHCLHCDDRDNAIMQPAPEEVLIAALALPPGEG